MRSVNQRLGWLWPLDFRHIPMSAYRTMAKLRMLELAAADLPLEEHARRIKVAPEAAAALRAGPTYQEVAHAVDECWQLAATPRRLEDHIADPMVQHKIAERTIRLGLHAGDTRVASKAVEQINDRAMPPQKQQQETRVLMLTPEMAQLIAETMRMVEPKPINVLPAEAPK